MGVTQKIKDSESERAITFRLHYGVVMSEQANQNNHSPIKMGESRGCPRAPHFDWAVIVLIGFDCYIKPNRPHLELHHVAEALELRQHVVVEVQEVVLQVLLAVLQRGVRVVVVAVTLVHAERHEHPADHQGGARRRVGMPPRTPLATESRTIT